MVKRDIRKIYSHSRMALSDDEIAQMSEGIVNNFRKLALEGAQVLLSYYPIPDRKEFDVTVCEQLLVLENENLRVAWPKILNDGTMKAVLIEKDGSIRSEQL